MKAIKKRVHIKNIVVGNCNYHRPPCKEHIDALYENIKRRGLKVPLAGYKKRKNSKRVYLYDGFMRFLAYKKVNNMKPPSRRRKTIDVFFNAEPQCYAKLINTNTCRNFSTKM